MIDFSIQRYAFVALLAAALFGAATPLAKQLLGEVHPVLLAGLLYCGSGLGLAVFSLARRLLRPERSQARFTARDLPWLIIVLACGGVAGPVLLLYGLSGVSASEASLLLNLESVLTVLLARVFFAEHVAPRVWLATALMAFAAAMLGWGPGGTFEFSAAAVAVSGACLAWALDNNATRRIAHADAVNIALLKGVVPGLINLALAALVGASWPAVGFVAASLALGAVSYGASLVLYIVAQRNLGSARTGAHFATAPFLGALLAVLLLDEHIGSVFLFALGLMVVSTALLLTERHVHRHRHDGIGHDHVHAHDDHHRHEHPPGIDSGQPHSHWHVHEPMTHAHSHLPDLHHRHGH